MRKPSYIAVLIILTGASFLAGVWYAHRPADTNSEQGRKIVHYHCPMHPQYTSDRPGDCPSCGMRLEPVFADDGDFSVADGSRPLPPGTARISPQRQQLIGVRSTPVERWSGTKSIRTVGRVAADENRLYRLNSSTELWVRKLYSPTTGSVVRKDEPLLEFYSTNFLSAAAAYMYALNTHDRQVATQMADRNQTQAVDYQLRQAIEGLQNLGVSDLDIAEMERTRKARDLVTLRSPANGIVISRTATLGQWVGSSSELYQIADLSQVWIFADLFENEARNLRSGMVVKVSAPAQELSFQARVSNVPPAFDATTRIMKVRLEARNPNLKLWPGMFVDVEIPAQLPDSLTVPSDSVVETGLRRIVFVDHGNGYFEPRQVETGWRFGGRIEITRGLMEGERIVVSGNFLVDSESRLRLAAAGLPEDYVLDPVCGMGIDPKKAGDKMSTYRGQTYYFCNPDCKAKFDAGPEKYLGKNKEYRIQNTAEGKMTGQAEGNIAKDPVCGMDVDTGAPGAIRAEYQGKTYYFCNPSCKESFQKNPGRYLPK